MKYFLSLIILLSFGRCYGKSVLWRVYGWQAAPWRGGPDHYSSLVSLLNDSGYTVDTTYDLTSKNLLSCDVIVIGALSTGFLTSEELDSLESYQQAKDGCVLLTGDSNFLTAGWIKQENKDFALRAFNYISKGGKGGIIIMSDYTALTINKMRPIARKFHMDLPYTDVSPSDLWFDSLDYSYLFFDGIDSLFFRKSGEVSATSPAKVIGWAPTGQSVIACFNCDYCLGVNEKINSTQRLLRATPNPFYHSVRIEGASGNIKVYDLSGKLVTEANNVWDGKDLNSNEISPGVYFLRAKNCRALKVIKLGN